MYLAENGNPLVVRNDSADSSSDARDEFYEAYELGFNWGMLADAHLFNPKLIAAEFQPRTKRNADALGIQLPEFGDARQVNDLLRILKVLENQKQIAKAVQGKTGIRGSSLFELGSVLQIVRGQYNPAKPKANKDFCDRMFEKLQQAIKKRPNPSWIRSELQD